ncbi:MAG: hypothetical protein R2820_00810 [Cyclobacteriaceae bacterium]|nr:Crp/Fnr family transcriptional regulator [Cyclobacteriaceae bacterium]
MKFIDFYRSIINEKAPSQKDLPFTIFNTEIAKGTIITDYGAVENRVYFINTGIIELAIKNDTSEKILDFFFPNEPVTCLTSFLLQIPSDTKMTALTDCEVEYFEHHEIYSNYPSSIEVNKLGRILVEHAYMRKAKREKEFLSKTAEELYLQLIEEHSQYIQQLPVNKLAKYLGIQPESLSRIRKKITS